ncbi:hypothetical protein SAMN05192550_0536 [Flavobacterium glycines]|uniref:Uncharacterized protein n=1 Tax=Flavobacterium glycines TaxID=551990 RepID=A0A1B9DP09_9FLAO|nr:hypothetical protein [Flavobacterium glycines]OCB71405.1 hypothetical protein FBGL_09170 [Flavobacterium glycines]GEL10425.1 hypothetical protein FGL01_11640 [Flavobacterium glycines]SDI68509.1 hypothetical protein SAMN05192550_0536 [Flavobacterium glycines]
MIALEGNIDFGGIIVIMIMIMVVPPILLSIIGFAMKKDKPRTAKVFFILAALYLLIGLGICGSILTA